MYTCLGNHDSRETYDKNHWYDYMNVGVYSEEKADGVQSVVRDTTASVTLFVVNERPDAALEKFNLLPEELRYENVPSIHTLRDFERIPLFYGN